MWIRESETLTICGTKKGSARVPSLGFQGLAPTGSSCVTDEKPCGMVGWDVSCILFLRARSHKGSYPPVARVVNPADAVVDELVSPVSVALSKRNF